MESLKQSRSRERSKATKILNKLKALYQAPDADPDDLAYLIHLSEKQLATLEQVGEELEQFEIQDDSSHASELEEVIFKSKRLLKRLEQPDSSQTHGEKHGKLKLDINLPKYSGDLLAWPEFWELFEAAAHRNSRYSPVEKFVYLRGHLTGEAARAIQGLATTTENYKIAVEILKDRFGRDALRKETLMANLLHLEGVANADDLKSLRHLIDDITANVRALEALGISSDSYGELLLPVLKGKIPESRRLQWARSRIEVGGSGESEFSCFMKFLQNEMKIREESTQVPCMKPKQSNTEGPATPLKSATSTLSTQRIPVPLHQRQPDQPPWPHALGISPHTVPTVQTSTMESQPECERHSDLCDASHTTKSTDHGVIPQRSCYNVMTQPHSHLYQTPDEPRRHSYRFQSVKRTCAPDNDDRSAEEASAEGQELPKPLLNEAECRYQKSNLDEKPLEAHKAQLTETIGDSVIGHATFANAAPSPGEAKDEPHGGEHASGSEETHISEEQIIPDKPAYEDAGERSTDQGLKQPPPEQCSSPSDDSEVALVSDLGTPLEDDPSYASYLPHRGPHRNGKLQTSFESSRRMKGLSTSSESSISTKRPTWVTIRMKKTWMGRQSRNQSPVNQLRASMSSTKRWKRKRWKIPMRMLRRRHFCRAAGGPGRREQSGCHSHAR